MNAGTTGLARFEQEIGRLNDILCAINILNWDARTKMPAAGATTDTRPSKLDSCGARTATNG